MTGDARPPDDRRLGEALVERGLISAEIVEDCLRDSAEDAGPTRPSLLQLLLMRRLIDSEQIASVLRDEATETLLRAHQVTLPEVPQADETPEQIGPYQLLERIGRGGMASVYEALDPRLGRRVALKLLNAPEGSDATLLLARQKREASLVARMRHPNIVPIHDTGEVPGVGHYIVMGLAEETLADRLDRGLTLEQGLVLFEQAVDGVASAHRLGVVHRDLKPSNLLLDGDRLLVADFGLARDLGTDSRLTATGTRLGTVTYMSPEQVAGRRQAIGPPSDVWSLGVVLYELLTGGHLPFGDDDRAPAGEIYEQILSGTPIPPRQWTAEAPPALERICLRCLARSPARRYADAGELAEALARWRRGESEAGLSQLAFAVRQRPLVAALAAVLALALMAGTGVALRVRSRRARRAADRKAAESAAAQGNWAAVLAAAERGLARGADTRLTELAATARRRLAEAHGRRQQRLARAVKTKALERELEPLARRLEGVRQLSYVPDVDYPTRLKDVEAAVRELKELLERPVNARQPRTWILLGTGYALLGWRREAQQALETARTLSPDDAQVRTALGRQYLEQAMARLLFSRSRKEDAQMTRRWAALAVECLKGSDSAWGATAGALERELAASMLAFAEQRPGDALRRATRALREFRGPGSEELLVLVAVMLQGADRMKAFDTALQRRPHYAWAYFMRGSAWASQRKWQEALADYGRALRIHPRMVYALSNRGMIHEQLGQLASARTDYERAIQLDPEFAEAYLNRGALRATTRQFKSALADFRRALALEPPPSLEMMIHNNRVMPLMMLGRPQEALAAAEKTIEMAPRYGQAYTARGFVREALGQLDGARADYDKGIALDPSEPRGFLTRGGLHLRQGRTTEALADIEQAIALDPRNYGALLLRGTVRLQRREHRLALADFTGLIALDPRQARGYLNRGVALSKLGRLDEALADYDRAIQRDPRYVQAHLNRAKTLAGRNRHAAALPSFDRVLELAPTRADVRQLRAVTRSRCGQLDGAIADFRQVATERPTWWNNWAELGVALTRAGRTAEARRALLKARDLAPAERRAEVEARLARLPSGD